MDGSKGLTAKGPRGGRRWKPVSLAGDAQRVPRLVKRPNWTDLKHGLVWSVYKTHHKERKLPTGTAFLSTSLHSLRSHSLDNRGIRPKLVLRSSHDLGDLQGSQQVKVFPRHLHMNATIGSHGEGSTDGLLSEGRGEDTADSHHLLNELLLLHLDRLLHGDLTEGVHGVLNAIRHHATVVRLHANLRRRRRRKTTGQSHYRGAR
ncbi:hypothetical protein EYF80_022319 [Liparis tanakae]|uniref:Uncharacterized protein n=1 Tax=Liparis tanakae TaxID=230148 RepID=A0A4Z2HR78_9TELE|nr:hypothetical protein EYF80_022319 [Liparis tanakae]